VLQKEFVALQRKLRKTVVFVTHDLDEAIRLADEIILMRDGEIVQQGPPERILAAPANEFVRNFVGNDRALKRLACFSVDQHMQTAQSVGENEVESIANGYGGSADHSSGNGHEGSGIYWIHDYNRHLIGLIDAATLTGTASREHITPVRARDISVSPLSDLREALSRLLGQGMRAVPVLDDEERVVGEVRLPDIEALNQTGFVR
jgi:osmoprotectant transport system ATP-binding protein